MAKYPWKDEADKSACLADAILSRLEFHGGMFVSDLMEGFKRSENAIRRHLLPLVKTNKVICKLPITKETHIRYVFPVRT